MSGVDSGRWTSGSGFGGGNWIGGRSGGISFGDLLRAPVGSEGLPSREYLMARLFGIPLFRDGKGPAILRQKEGESLVEWFARLIDAGYTISGIGDKTRQQIKDRRDNTDPVIEPDPTPAPSTPPVSPTVPPPIDTVTPIPPVQPPVLPPPIPTPDPIIPTPDPIPDDSFKVPPPVEKVEIPPPKEGQSWWEWALDLLTLGIPWGDILKRNPPGTSDLPPPNPGTSDLPPPNPGTSDLPPPNGGGPGPLPTGTFPPPGNGTTPPPGDVIIPPPDNGTPPPPDNTATPPPDGDTMPPDDDKDGKDWRDWLDALIPLLPILFPPDDPDPGGTSVTQVPPPGQNEILDLTLPILKDFINNPPEIQPRPVHPFTPLELQGHESILGAIPGIRGQMDFLRGQQQETAGAQKYFKNVRGGTHALGQALSGLGQQQGPQQHARQWAGQPYGNPKQPQKAASPSGGLGKLLRGGQ